MKDWRQWTYTQGMLSDGQIWEGDSIVVQIEKLNDDYRTVMFKRTGDKLMFVTVAIYDDEEKLFYFLNKYSMQPTSKILTIRRV